MAKSAKREKKAKSASSVTKYSRPRLSPELKWFDVNQAPAIVPAGLAGAVWTLNAVQQGTGPNQRIGRTLMVKQIDVKINMQAQWSYIGATVPIAASISYRVDLILDKQCNGALPNGADVYDTLIAGVAPENRFMNLLNSDRFTLIKRWEGDLNPPGFIDPSATNTTVQVARDLKLTKKCNIRLELSPQPGATTIADVRSNNLFIMMTYSLGAAGLGFQVINTADSRIRFYDS